MSDVRTRSFRSAQRSRSTARPRSRPAESAGTLPRTADERFSAVSSRALGQLPARLVAGLVGGVLALSACSREPTKVLEGGIQVAPLEFHAEEPEPVHAVAASHEAEPTFTDAEPVLTDAEPSEPEPVLRDAEGEPAEAELFEDPPAEEPELLSDTPFDSKAFNTVIGIGGGSGGAYGGRMGGRRSSRSQGAGAVLIVSEREPSTEDYDRLRDNDFVRVADDPLSTFSIDVDTASYANVRRFLTDGELPPPDAVRIEELLNAFPYAYAEPAGADPFAVDVEVASAPWAESHRLVRIGLRGRAIPDAERAPRRLVFLVDVSGSMAGARKLPLLKRGLALLVETLDARDTVALVVYAGAAGVVLPPTSGARQAEILAALERLDAGGSTNGGEGIRLAYALAREGAVAPGAQRRVILATDGDFNVGVSDRGSLVRLVEAEAASGVFLTVLGFGTGNLKDARMEELADRGNGNYAYVDSLAEARKVLVAEGGATLETIAKDVKIQVELNPAAVERFRLIGYVNRKLAHRDFADDAKDAGEIGAGHRVTALYELVPAGVEPAGRDVAPLRYQTDRDLAPAARAGELLTVRLRWKAPDDDASRLLEVPVVDGGAPIAAASTETRFAAALAAFGMLLRGSEHAGTASAALVLELARSALGADEGGHRAGFVSLVERWITLRAETLADR